MAQAVIAAAIFLGGCLVLASSILISVRLYQERPEFVIKVMKYALVVLFMLGFAVASFIIGIRIEDRHSSTYSRNLKSVQEIWGSVVSQSPPDFGYYITASEEYENPQTGKYETRKVRKLNAMGMDLQKVDVKIKSNIRQKGLLKYAGYELEFTGKYRVKNYRKTAGDFHFDFEQPGGAGNITGIKVLLNGKDYEEDTNLADGFQWNGKLKPGETREFQIQYRAQGTERFIYLLSERQLQIRELEVSLTSDFTDVRIPDRAMPPLKKAGDSKTTRLNWKSENLITGQNIAVKFEIKGNYGGIAARMFLYSPLALFLFTGLLLIAGAARQYGLHPMHYLFLMTGFFIFYLFGSYAISILPHIIIGIGLSLLLSTGIMLYYAFLIKKGQEFIRTVAFASLCFQWVFSIAFFFPAYTGFMITVAAILSFIALMRISAEVDWANKW